MPHSIAHDLVHGVKSRNIMMGPLFSHTPWIALFPGEPGNEATPWILLHNAFNTTYDMN